MLVWRSVVVRNTLMVYFRFWSLVWRVSILFKMISNLQERDRHTCCVWRGCGRRHKQGKVRRVRSIATLTRQTGAAHKKV